VSEEQPDNST